MEVAQQFSFWAKLMITHRVKIISLLMSLSAIGGALATATLLTPRVASLESKVKALQDDVGTLKASEETKMYILCTLLRRVDKYAVPPKCAADPERTSLKDRNEVWSAVARLVYYIQYNDQ